MFNEFIALHFVQCIMYTSSLVKLKVTRLNEKIARIKRR